MPWIWNPLPAPRGQDLMAEANDPAEERGQKGVDVHELFETQEEAGSINASCKVNIARDDLSNSVLPSVPPPHPFFKLTICV